jgi:RND family efflux transporter MFP subunit
MPELPHTLSPIEHQEPGSQASTGVPGVAGPVERSEARRNEEGTWQEREGSFMSILGLRWRWLVLGAVLVVAAGAAVFVAVRRERNADAGQQQGAAQHGEIGPAPVRVVKPELKTMVYAVPQPGFVEAYEQTAIFSKVSGFIQKFNVDIGDQLKLGQVLCEIFVPELVQQHEQMLAQVKLDRSSIHTAAARQKEAEANVEKSRAEVVRWESELNRMTRIAAEKVVDLQTLDETRKQFESQKASYNAAQASVLAWKAEVETAKAKLEVSQADERRLAALLDYTHIAAPYDAVVTVRNANTGDYVESVSGEKMSSGHVPIFVVARTDLARVFVDVPEQYARYVQTGTKAAVSARALSGQDIPGVVARTSWSLNKRSRTLRTEIDLPVAKYGIRPGMYVVGKVIVERPRVYAVPHEALIVLGDETYAFLVENGKTVKTPVEPGMDDGTSVEVVRKKAGNSWQPIDGSEQLVLGNLSEMVDGQSVAVAPPAPSAEQAAQGQSG